MARSALNVLVGATLTPLEKSLKKGVGLVKGFSSQASKIVAGGGGIGGAIAGAVGGISVAAGLKMSVDRFREAELANVRLKSTLKASGDQAGATAMQIVGFAKQMQAATGIATSETQDAAGAFIRSGITDTTAIKQGIKAAADMAAVMGGQVAPTAEQVAKALKNPREGYLELAAAGVRFSDSNLKVLRDMNAVGDASGAAGVILAALQEQFGGAAEAAGNTLDGSIKKLYGSIDELSKIVGETLAPFIKVAVQQMTEWVKGLDNAGNRNSVILQTAKALGFVVDTLQAMEIAWKVCQGAADVFVGSVAWGIQKLLRGFAKLIDIMEMIPGTAKGVADQIRSFADESAGAFSVGAFDNAKNKANEVNKALRNPTASAGVMTAFENIRKEVKKTGDELDALKNKGQKSESLFGKLTTSIKNFGSEIKNSLNITPKLLTKEQIDAMGEADKLILSMTRKLENFDWDDYAAKARELNQRGLDADSAAQVGVVGAKLHGKELAQSLETPFEKLEREMKKLKTTFDLGGIDEQTFARAKGKLTADFQQSLPENKIQAGGPLMAGSQEARSALMSFRNASRNADPQFALAKQAEIQTEELKNCARYLRDIAHAKPQSSAFAGL